MPVDLMESVSVLQYSTHTHSVPHDRIDDILFKYGTVQYDKNSQFFVRIGLMTKNMTSGILVDDTVRTVL